MSNEWEALDMRDIRLSAFIDTQESGYEYQVMRRKARTERDKFIVKASRLFNNRPDKYNSEAATLYDAGARFK